MANRASLVRVGVLTMTAAALVLGASRVEGGIQLAAPHERAGLPATSDALVKSATLACPGQVRVGTPGMRDVSGVVQVSAAAAPAAALTGAAPAGTLKGALKGAGGAASGPATGPGLVSLVSTPGTSLASTDGRAAVATVQAEGTAPVMALGEGALAPGLAAAQSWLHTGDDDRGLALTPCTQASADIWLIGGGGGPSRTERVVITNPGANAVSVRLEVFGAGGRVDVSNGAATSIPPRARVSLALDALAPEEARPAVHVVATGGVVSAVLNDAWIDGATARGVADATRTTAPARELMLAGADPAPAGQGDTILRLVNPGADEALARVTVLTAAGPTQPAALRAIRVAAGATLDVPLTLATGSTGLRITADQPVTAAVFVERRQASGDDREGDFGWVPATPPIARVGGVVIPTLGRPGVSAVLHLAVGEAGGTVTSTIGAGASVRTVTTEVKPNATATVDLGTADRVWVATDAPDIHAALGVAFTDRDVPYYEVVPVLSAPTTQTVVPVRQVAN